MRGKSLFAAAMVGAVLWTGASSARAGEYQATDDFFKACGNKIVRGAINTVTGWVEIVNQPAKMTKKDGAGKGLTLGLLKGFWYGIGRTGHGIAEMGGFFLANHQSNDNIGVPLDAEFAWEEGTPAKEYGKPIGDKLGRGVIDFFTGWLEIAGQPVKLSKSKGAGYGWTVGLLKGFWFGISREGSGLAEAFGCPFPNPVDTAGYPLDSLRSYDAFEKK